MFGSFAASVGAGVAVRTPDASGSSVGSGVGVFAGAVVAVGSGVGVVVLPVSLSPHAERELIAREEARAMPINFFNLIKKPPQVFLYCEMCFKVNSAARSDTVDF